ncbi:MAG: tetratricopeptide repeat protein [Aureliella sp.]
MASRSAKRRTGKSAQPTKPSAPKSAPLRAAWWHYAILALCVFVVYSPVADLQWIWDDDQYVYANPVLRDANALSQIWFNVDATPQYYPLIFSVFWALYQLVGTDPQLYHLLNLGLHAFNACLLLACLNRIRLRASFWIALCFALHPIQVETVAWVTELKNLLSTTFFGLSWLLLWPLVAPDESIPLPLSRESQSGTGTRALRYLSSLGLFVGALLSKSVTASMPAALLVVLWFRFNRVTLNQIIALVPFFTLGAVFGLRTASLEKVKVGAMGVDWDYGLLERVGIVARSLLHYASNLVAPIEQMFFYPRFEPQFSLYAGAALLLIFLAISAATVLAFRGTKGTRGPLAGILFFAGSAFPALGFFNVYPHRFSFVADHFVYLPIVGLMALWMSAAYSLVQLAARKFEIPNYGVPLAMSILVSLFAIQTLRYVPVFASEITLWEDTLAKNPECTAAMQNLGLAYMLDGRHADAESVLTEAQDSDFDRYQTLNSLGLVLARQNKNEQAIAAFESSVRLNPKNEQAWLNLGNMKRRSSDRSGDLEGKLQEKNEPDASYYYLRSMLAKPNYTAAFALGAVAVEKIDAFSAVAWFSKAVELRPTDLDSQFNLALSLQLARRPQEAIRVCKRILQVFPDDEPTKTLLEKLQTPAPAGAD